MPAEPVEALIQSYTSARDLFEAAREAARDAERISRAVERMRSREQLRAQGYQPRTSGGGRADPNAATDARVDYERRVARRREADLALMSYASSVCYGDGAYAGGVASLLTPAHADALWWRYVNAATWPETAEGTGMSERWCRDAVAVALDQVDAYGFGRVRSGLGLAEA
ncbi:MAG: hypothetical protein SOY67_04310 [Collinsella sp.]|nr:hypothetical protein [Collinsella sp.]